MNTGSALLLLSAFFHAGWNALAKSAKEKEAFLFLAMVCGSVLSLLATWWMEGSPLPAATPSLTYALGSGICEGLYLFSLGRTLRQSSLGTSYAVMRGGAMVLVWAFSLVFVGETASALQALGAGLVLSGILVMNTARKSGESVKAAGNLWAYLSALFIAGYHIFYHQALDKGAQPISLFTVSILVSLPLVFFAIPTGKTQRMVTTLKTGALSVFLTGLLAALSFVIFLYGLQISAPGFAISLRNTSIFFAILFSFVLKESLTRPQILGAAIIGTGAVLLSF